MPTQETMTVTLYQLSELDDRAREKAIEAFRDTNVDYDGWWESVYEWKTEELEEAGIISPRIYFEGFYHQGSHARFIGSVDLAAWMKSQKLAKKYRTLYNAATEGHIRAEIASAYRDSARAEVEVWSYPNWDKQEKLDEQANAVQELLEEWRRDKSHDIYKALRDEYEYLTSDEAVAESIEANEHKFTEEGEPEFNVRFNY